MNEYFVISDETKQLKMWRYNFQWWSFDRKIFGRLTFGRHSVKIDCRPNDRFIAVSVNVCRWNVFWRKVGEPFQFAIRTTWTIIKSCNEQVDSIKFTKIPNKILRSLLWQGYVICIKLAWNLMITTLALSPPPSSLKVL